MKRELAPYILSDLEKKIVLLTGPRQSGKTTLAKSLWSESEYFNYDLAERRALLLKKSCNRHTNLVIFDELHKMKGKKNGLVDKDIVIKIKE